MCSWLIDKHAHALIGLHQLVLSRTIRLFRCTRDRYLWMIRGLDFYWLVCFVALGSKGLIWNHDVGHPLALRHKGARAPFDWVGFAFVICQDKGLVRMTRWFFATWVVWIWLAYKNRHTLSRYNVIRQQDFIMAYLATKSQDITPLFFPTSAQFLFILHCQPRFLAIRLELHKSIPQPYWLSENWDTSRAIRHFPLETNGFVAREATEPSSPSTLRGDSFPNHPPTFRSAPLVSQQS